MQQVTRRTPYMQQIMMDTYTGIAIEAIYRGFAGSWERLIAKRLVRDAQIGISEAELILESCSNDVMKAAHLVTGSKVETASVGYYGDEIVMIIDNNIINL